MQVAAERLACGGAHYARGLRQLHHAAQGPVPLPFEGGPLKTETRPLSKGAIDTLLRGCFHAAPGKVLVVSDWSQVEARINGWQAGDADMLTGFDLFDSGDKVNGDPYVNAACGIFGRSPADYFESEGGKQKLNAWGKPRRQVGKVAFLGLGFQMGGPRFHDFAADSGCDWEALYPLNAADVVKAWRRKHAPIVESWYAMQEAAIEVTKYGGQVECGPFLWSKVNGLVTVELPSGRLIAYQGMRVTKKPDVRGRERDGLVFMGKRGPDHTFGGKLIENAVQATGACLLRLAHIECERVGLPVVLTSHDEIVCEVEKRDGEEAYAALTRIMCKVHSWAEGLPLAAAGYIAERYRKE